MMVSVVIPVFNAAIYLEACVASLRKLPLQQEIILVDDGSTDGSGELCDRLGDKVLHQANQGVSAARNAGMQVATGDWLWFVDADDYVEPLAENIQIPSSGDFVNLGFVWEENGNSDVFGASEQDIPYNLWRCWFRRDQIQKWDLMFTAGRKYAEDQEFILKYLLSVKGYKSAAIPQLQYHYTVRPGSAMTRKGVKGKQFCDILGVLSSMWVSALANGNMPFWLFPQTKRMLKTAWVAVIR